MDIPDFLEQQLKESKVVLCLGAGTALNARDDRGNGPPTGKGLAGLLANRFLGGNTRTLRLHRSQNTLSAKVIWDRSSATSVTSLSRCSQLQAM
jgi:hypothetical protein